MRPNKIAYWDYGVRPGSESRGNASASPTWEFIKEFPMKDGKLYNDPTGKYYTTDDHFLQDYWENIQKTNLHLLLIKLHQGITF